jgi:TfoX/Sxy family transcriptional regulator of competence genes
MAWIKVPQENHPLFHAALPKDPRVSTINMFGGVAAKTKGRIFAGLFARSVIVKLSPDDQKAAMQVDGTAPFDPMGNGRVMGDTLLLGESVMDEADELRSWIAKAFAYAQTQPAKAEKPAKKAAAKARVKAKAAPAKKPAPRPAAKKPAPKKKPARKKA